MAKIKLDDRYTFFYNVSYTHLEDTCPPKSSKALEIYLHTIEAPNPRCFIRMREG